MKCMVNSPLHHDNKAYAIGQMVEMEDEHAEPLIVLGRIIPVIEPASDSEKKPSEKKSSEKKQASS